MNEPANDSGVNGNDSVLGFTVPHRHARGRLARMTVSVREVLAAHDYPAPLAKLLGEALMLTALLGATMREEEGQLTLQAQAEGGPVQLLVCDWRAGSLRGYLQLREGHGEVAEGATLSQMFGTGYLAITLEQTRASERYQGIVPLEGESLCRAVEGYFSSSEQVPTLLRVAVDLHEGGWVAGGLLVQHLPEGEIGKARLFTHDVHPDWQHVATLTGSIDKAELTDESLPLDTLLWRLLNEDEVRVIPAVALRRQCHCSADHFRTVLMRFPEDERAEMRTEEGLIVVNCEFCNKSYPLDI